MKRKMSFRLGLAAILLAFLVAVIPCFALASKATSQPSSAPMTAAQDPRSMLSAGLEQALAGNYEQGLVVVSKAAKLAPEDDKIDAAQKLLKDYLAYCAKVEAERSTEYASTVQRVGWSEITQAYGAKLAGSKVDKKLRDKVRNVILAVGRAGNSETIEGALNDGADMKAKSVKAYDDATAALAEAVKLLPEKKSPYAKVFLKTTESLGQRLTACKQVWASMDANNASAKKADAKELKTLEDGLGDDLSDLADLTSDKPWREALLRARLAKQVASPKDKMTEQDWYVKLVKDIEKHGEEFVKSAEWYDALTAYVGLEDLDETNENYKNMVKQVRRHVRVLRLYGKEPPLDEGKAETRPADPEPTWQELVEGVDADMAEKAISQLDSYYVTPIDYRKLSRGALMAVKVLAETPQAAASFPTLSDKAKKDAFIKAIDEQIRVLDDRDRLDHLDLTLAMNNVLRVSERTVGIPVEPLVAEFTDGFLDELDEFSTMIWPHDVADFEKQTMGHFYGVGIQIAKEPGEPLRVVTPLADTPAFKAGIKTGDYVLAVDGRATEDLGVDKLVRMITGEKGTKVTLRIKRSGRVEPFDVTLKRDEINIATVRGWHRNPDGQWDYTVDGAGKIGYIRVTQFTDQTPGDFAEALTNLKEQGIKSLVVDVRFNPGGLLRSATDVADQFLSSGRLVSTEGRQTKRSEVNADAGGKYLSGDLMVLINQTSASAAEILSGAIKDHNRGTIIGQRTYGKGSVQNVIPIRRQRAVLKLTTAYYYLPSGRLVHRRNGQKDWGVDPDVEVRVTPKQMRRWLDIRSKTDLLQEVDPRELSGDLARQYDADIQLRAAVLMLEMKQLREGLAASQPVVATH